MNLVRHVDDEQPLHLTDDRVAFRTIGNLSLLVVEPVVLGLNEACVVGAADVLAGAECEEGIRIRPGGRPAERPHHQLPDARRLRVLRPLVDLELDADAERLQLTLPHLVECAIELTRLRREFEHERRAVGLLAPAVAVDIDIAVRVQQRACACAVELAHLADERRVVAAGQRRDLRLRRNHRAAPDQADLLVGVVAERDRTSERNLVRLVAADDRVLHVEVGDDDVGIQQPVEPDAAFRQRGRELAGRCGDVDVFERDVDRVLLAVQKRQPARLAFLDDRELDAIDHRQPATLQAPQHCGCVRISGRWLSIEQLFAIARIAFEHDSRRALPLGEAERAGPDRVRHHVVGVGFDDIACHRTEHAGVGQVLVEARLGTGEADPERIAVDRVDAFDLGVVVEFPARLRSLARLAQADHLRGLDARPRRALPARIGNALQLVDVVGRRQFALLALERRIVLEGDPRPDAHRDRAEVSRDFRHCCRGARKDLRGSSEIVVLQRRLEDVRDDVVRI